MDYYSGVVNIFHSIFDQVLIDITIKKKKGKTNKCNWKFKTKSRSKSSSDDDLPAVEQGAKRLYMSHLRPFLLKHQARMDQILEFVYREMVSKSVILRKFVSQLSSYFA